MSDEINPFIYVPLPPSPTPDFTETNKLILEANIALGRIPGPEVELARQQLEQKIQQEQELKAAQQAEIDAENNVRQT